MAWFAFLWNTWDERIACHIRFYSTWTAKLLALLVINPMEATMIFSNLKRSCTEETHLVKSLLYALHNRSSSTTFTLLTHCATSLHSRLERHHTLNLFQPFIHRGSMNKCYHFWEELHLERNYLTNIIHKSTTCLVLSMSYTGLVFLVCLF